MRRLAAALVLAFLAAAFLPAAEKPSLVVVISVDQMRADYLERFRPWFRARGFNRFLLEGAVYTRAAQRHAVTFTAPGHASIGSGLDPRDHGIIGNRWFDEVLGASVYCTDDPQTRPVPPIPGRKSPWGDSSPARSSGVFLGDRLKERFPGARVVGIALKDRAAILMAGRKADAALWFDQKQDRFVTSSYYPPHPELLAFNDAVPAFLRSHTSWELSGRIPPEELLKVTFDPPELYRYKNPEPGFGESFPHALGNTKAVVSSPYGDELVLTLARHAVERLRLGSHRDEPDLLFIGLSSTDYYGHPFGPDSREIADGMVRLDATLDAFFSWLDEKVGRGSALVFLTADHGVTPIPEVARARYRLRTGTDDLSIAGRVDLDNRGGDSGLVSDDSADRLALERDLAKRFRYDLSESQSNFHEGALLFFEEPGLYLNKAVLARRRVPIEAAKDAARDFVRRLPGVLAAYTNTEIGDGLPAGTPFALAIARSFRADRSGDVFVVLRPGWMWSYGKNAGTTHGQPGDDDSRVPLGIFGPGVSRGSFDAPVSPLSIARTIAALFGFEAGEPDAVVLDAVVGQTTPAATAR